MANGMGSLYIGASGLQNSQNALNTTANNLSNVDTQGYVRQQVLFADRTYVNFERNAAVSIQQSGLGVTIADVVHTRDVFLDKYYRMEAGRQAFYEKTYETVTEVEDFFQEMEGSTYQNTLNDFWVSFQELAKQPDSSVNQNLIVQKATLFLERAQAIYDDTKSYQKNMNVQIEDAVKRINELGDTIYKLNIQIQTIEAGHTETAMSLRDQRDNALDELASLVKIDYKETAEGIVKINIEGVGFIDEAHVYNVGLHEDRTTEFVTPYWPHLSDEKRDQIYEVFDFSTKFSTANDTDIGGLKAMVLARGHKVANYTDIEGLTADQYNNGVGQSVILNTQAELDQMMHTIATTINDLLCPNKTVTFQGEDMKIYENVLVWDEEKASIGSDGVKPGHELFTRRGIERYTEMRAKDGTIYYVYNEEDPTDSETQYTVSNMKINETLLQEESHFPHITMDNGEIDFELANKLADVWAQDLMKLNPNDADPCTFTEYYQRLIDSFATEGSIYSTLSYTLEGSVTSIENQRQQVVGVSSDEELSNMIKYQNAYNAASRYINVISEMIEHIVLQLGA